MQLFSVDEWVFEGAPAPNEKIGGIVPFKDYRAHVIDSFRRNVSSDAFFYARIFGRDATRVYT